MQQVVQSSPRRLHALRYARGARGVDDICARGAVHVGQRAWRARRLSWDDYRADAKTSHAAQIDVSQHVIGGDQDAQPRVTDHVLRRETGVERHVGVTCLQDSQLSHHGAHVPRQRDPNQSLVGTCERLDLVSEVVGERIELSIGEGVPAAADRRRQGRRSDPGAEP